MSRAPYSAEPTTAHLVPAGAYVLAEINRSISLLLILGFEHFVQCHKCSPRLRFVIGEAVVKKLLVE